MEKYCAKTQGLLDMACETLTKAENDIGTCVNNDLKNALEIIRSAKNSIEKIMEDIEKRN